MMAGPTGSAILVIYGRGMAAGPAERASLLCAAAGGDSDRLSVGDVDRAIWGWLRATFDGPHDAVLTCAACGDDVEFTLPDDFAWPARQGDDMVTVVHGGAEHRMRMPRLADLRGGTLARDRLADGAPWDDPAFAAAAEAALLEADPGIRVEVRLDCAACGAAQVTVFDAAGFAWARLEQAARRVVREVATLARAFGWSEAELTAMTPERRAIWLAEVEG